MNLNLAIRAVTLLAFVALSTALIVQPDALGLETANQGSALTHALAVARF